MMAEQILFEQDTTDHRRPKPEPDPLFNLAERIARWSHDLGLPATDREWFEAIEAGLIQPRSSEHSTI